MTAQTWLAVGGAAGAVALLVVTRAVWVRRRRKREQARYYEQMYRLPDGVMPFGFPGQRLPAPSMASGEPSRMSPHEVVELVAAAAEAHPREAQGRMRARELAELAFERLTGWTVERFADELPLSRVAPIGSPRLEVVLREALRGSRIRSGESLVQMMRVAQRADALGDDVEEHEGLPPWVPSTPVSSSPRQAADGVWQQVPEYYAGELRELAWPGDQLWYFRGDIPPPGVNAGQGPYSALARDGRVIREVGSRVIY